MPENAVNCSKQLVNVQRFTMAYFPIITKIHLAVPFLGTRNLNSPDAVNPNNLKVAANTITTTLFMVVDLHVPVEVKVNSLDLARSVPLTVPRSNLCGN